LAKTAAQLWRYPKDNLFVNSSDVDRRFGLITLSVCLWFYVTGVLGAGEESGVRNERQLHELIDEHIEAGWNEDNLHPAVFASDAEFLRRVFLDLTGMIPAADIARTFLEDDSPEKRARLIDRLLDSPEYSLHMARVMDVMLNERRIATIRSYNVPIKEWLDYLTSSFAENKRWDQLVLEILSTDGTDAVTGPAARFYLSRDVKPDLLTRDVGRLFLGVDLQCAQCHDDPRYVDYKQADYFGIYAFVSRLSLFHDKDTKQTLLAEKAVGDVTFTSVFTGSKGETNPRLPGGAMLPDPDLEKEQQYKVAPASGVRSVPGYSRRLQLGQQLPRRETAGFSLNIVNRLWAQMLGRGLVEPLDLRHAKNPPSHPELLILLAQRFESLDYNIKAMLRELALTRTYQRSSLLPENATTISPNRFAVAPLRALSPEQLAWSVLQASGRLSVHLKEVDQRLKSEDPKHYDILRRTWKWNKEAYDRFGRDVNSVAAVFAVMPGNPEGAFAPTVDQALFLLNSDTLPVALKPDPGTLIDGLVKEQSSDDLAKVMFLSIFSRRPDANEIAEVRDHLHDVPAEMRVEAIRQLVAGKLMSAEFRLNH
jgi:hypothetical protein